MSKKNGDTVSVREFYEKLESISKDIAAVDDKVGEVNSKVENINGKIMYIPILISSVVSFFTIFANFILNKR